MTLNEGQELKCFGLISRLLFRCCRLLAKIYMGCKGVGYRVCRNVGASRGFFLG